MAESFSQISLTKTGVMHAVSGIGLLSSTAPSMLQIPLVIVNENFPGPKPSRTALLSPVLHLYV